MKNSLLYLGLSALLITTSACRSGQSQAGAEAAEPGGETVLYAEDFDSYEDGELPPGWWVEGGEAVYVEDGRLMIEADPERKRAPGHVATLWNKRRFSGDIRVEFDAHVLASSMGVNNINLFLYYSHPGAETTLYEIRKLRSDASYNHYKDLNGYIFTFVKAQRAEKEGAARFRMRRCPGFELIDETFAYRSLRGHTYHVTITKRGDRLSFAVDGTVYLRALDEKYNWTEGLMGLRTFHTDLWIDNLKITRPERGI